MSKRIVIEGMDCSGKTTLINKIKKIYPEAESVHFPTCKWEKDEPITDFMAKDMSRVWNMDADILLIDRFWPSTMVYQFMPMWKEKSISWAMRWSAMSSFLENILPIDEYILCTVDYGEWIQRLDIESKGVLKREFRDVVDTSDPYEVWKLIDSAYSSFITSTNEWKRVDTETLSDNEIVKLVEEA